jgi:hypothetical protein
VGLRAMFPLLLKQILRILEVIVGSWIFKAVAAANIAVVCFHGRES